MCINLGKRITISLNNGCIEFCAPLDGKGEFSKVVTKSNTDSKIFCYKDIWTKHATENQKYSLSSFFKGEEQYI